MAAIVEDALAMFKTMDLAADIAVDVQVEEGLVVRGDRAALVQAVGNLLSNAWKYTRPDGRRIAVSAAADPKHVYISVIDNGLGIAAERTGAHLREVSARRGRARAGRAGIGPGARHRARHRRRRTRGAST